MKRFWRLWGEDGQAMVEWALVFPLFILLLFAVIEFGWLGYQQLLFESTYQMSAWDFPLTLQKEGGGKISDTDIIAEVRLKDFTQMQPANAVVLGDDPYPLGAGIKQYMVKSVSDLLDESKLSVENAAVDFSIEYAPESYPTGPSTGVRIDAYQVKSNIHAELKYTVEAITPVGKMLLDEGKLKIRKTLVRERTERVAVKRKVTIPLVP